MPAPKNSVFRLVQKLICHRDDQATAATTLTANAAAAATSLTVASITGLSNGDTIRIGAGNDTEVNKINGAPSGSTVTLLWPLGKAHLSGESTRRQISYDHGDPDESGVKVAIEADTVDVPVATRRIVFTRLDGYVRATMEWAWPTFTLQNLAAALGMLTSRVTGSGTQASPWQITTDGAEIGEDINQSWTVYGILVDGSFLAITLHGTDMLHEVVKASLRRGQVGTVNAKAKASSMVTVDTAQPTFTLSTSLLPTKGKVFDAPSEVGFYSATGGGMSSTLTGAHNAAVTALIVASSTNGAAGDRVKIGTGDTAEMNILDSITDATHVVARGKTYRAFAGATPIVEQTRNAFGGMSEEGLDISFDGDGRDVKLATSRIEGGRVPGMAAFKFSFMVVDLLVANIAYALGVPQSAIASGRFNAGNNIGSADLTELYFSGLHQDGGTVEIECSGCSQVIENFALALNNKDLAKLPITAIPASVVTFRQY